MERKKYIVAQTMAENMETGRQEKVYYVHLEGYPYVPVWGSIGGLQHARAVCRLRNSSIGR